MSGNPTMDSLTKRRPALARSVEAYHAFAATMLDPAIVELCRLRIGQITTKTEAPISATPASDAAGVTAGQLRELGEWRDSAEFTAKEKACIEFAEYFCYSAQAVSDDQVARVSEFLAPDQVLTLTTGLWVSDASSRLENYLRSLEVKR